MTGRSTFRAHLWWWGGLLMGVVLIGCTAATIARPSQAPQPQFASYVDVTDAHSALAAVGHDGGQHRYVLSFVLAGTSGCAPTWGGVLPLGDNAIRTQIAALRQSGDQVRVASGGANGTYLETACSSAQELATAYLAAIDATGADQFEVDIEHGVPADRVADALTIVRDRRHIDLTVTVGVVDASRGLDPAVLPLLRALAARGTDVTVNAMAMNFPYQGSWRDAVIRSAETVTGQLQGLWPGLDRNTAYRRLGLTVMAGRNDTGATTTLDDASAIRNYAVGHGVGRLGLWSLGRDNGGYPGESSASSTCSGITQQPFEFTHRLSGVPS